MVFYQLTDTTTLDKTESESLCSEPIARAALAPPILRVEQSAYLSTFVLQRAIQFRITKLTFSLLLRPGVTFSPSQTVVILEEDRAVCTG